MDDQYDIYENDMVKLYYKKGSMKQNWISLYKEKNGILHRLDGPACIYSSFYRKINPKEIDEWWVEGKRLSPDKEIILNSWYERNNNVLL